MSDVTSQTDADAYRALKSVSTRYGIRDKATSLKRSGFMEESVMLVLGRKVGESIDIGEGIKVTVVAINGNGVTIGIDAPGDAQIRHEEIPQWEDASYGEKHLLRPNSKKAFDFAIA